MEKLRFKDMKTVRQLMGKDDKHCDTCKYRFTHYSRNPCVNCDFINGKWTNYTPKPNPQKQ